MLIYISSLLPLLGFCNGADIDPRWTKYDNRNFGDAEDVVKYTTRSEYVKEESGLYRLIQTTIPITTTPRWINSNANTEPVPRRVSKEEKRHDKPVEDMSRTKKFTLPNGYQSSKPIPIPSHKLKSPRFESNRRPTVTSGYNGKYNTTGCDESESKLEEFGNAMHDLHRDIFTV